MGIQIAYNSPVVDLIKKDNKICGVIAIQNNKKVKIFAKSTILACGSFESNPQMRAKYLGNEWKNIKLRGLMGMASFTDDENIIKNQFNKLNNLYIQKKDEIDSINTLSMGMSNDYKLALEHGSNMIRIGSKIFGERNYH